MKFIASEIENLTLDIIANHFGKTASTLRKEDEFIKDLKADSLEIVALMIELEEKFEFLIEDNEVPKIKTVQGAIDFVKSKLFVDENNACGMAEI